MPHFADHLLHDPELPARFAPVLQALADFEAGCTAPEPDRQALEVQHRELLELAREQLPATPGLLDRDTAVRGFCLGVLLLAHYERTVVADLPVVDTVGCRSLPRFATDLADGTTEIELRDALTRAFDLRASDHAALNAVLQPELDRLDLRHRVIEELDRRFPLVPGASELDANVFALFSGLYVGNPLRVGEVGVVRTGTSLFFTVDFTGMQLDEPVGERTPNQWAEVRAFIRKFSLVRQAHFPSFGFFHATNADPELVAELAAAVGMPVVELLPKLTSMVSILNQNKLDQYLVHDAWGHQWQALLLPFEEDFHPLPALRRPPGLHWSGLEQAIEKGGPWDSVLRTAFEERLIAGLSGPITELLADVVEHKLGDLPSSSLFPSWPTKLDLTMTDLGVYLSMGLRGLERFVADDRHAEVLADEFLDANPHVDADAAREAVADFRRRAGELLEHDYHQGFRFELAGEAVKVNAWSRMALNLLGLHTCLNDTYGRLAASDREYPPALLHYHDLLVLSVGALFQLEPRRHFWHLDEFLVGHFEHCLERLIRALR